MFEALKRFNFGENFIKWVHILYTNPIFRIKNNGWISKTCMMQRGIRQGCPISAILFLFVAEILGISIRNNPSIQGFQKEGMDNDIRIIQHADDSTLPMKNEKSLKKALEVINDYSIVSGMRLNMSKTECILTGPLKNRYKKLHNVNVNITCIKVLGVYIGHNKEMCLRNNWTKITSDVEKLFESWKTRNLTIFGKVCIINSLVISKIIYIASILNLPDPTIIKDFQRRIFNFIWNKRDRIKRNTLIGTVDNGGIGVVDILSKIKSIRTSWIKQILNKRSPLYPFVNSICVENDYDLGYLVKTNITDIKQYI